MALLRSVLGTITQSMGGVTATTWKGKNVLKQKVAETNTSNTPAQAQQRRKFAALAKLGGLFGPAIRIGYRVAAAKVTEQNAFYTANQDAVTDNGTEASIDMAMLEVSTGIVGGVMALDVQFATATGTAIISWNDNSNGADALPGDYSNVVVTNILTGATQILTNGETRSALGTTVVDAAFIGAAPANIRAYVFFKRATNTASSPSSTAVAHA